MLPYRAQFDYYVSLQKMLTIRLFLAILAFCYQNPQNKEQDKAFLARAELFQIQ